ncbi:hypothetical protein V6N11_018346 [Hibiscus sabdariffa]|uniref:Uncharacterized protein n=1 Tax=Hibiscus sabdariffa TaxID=183260 RepID=A0ABR2T754_9ROSI
MEDASGTSFSQSVEERTITLRPKIELYGALLNDLEFHLLHSFLASVVDSIRPWRKNQKIESQKPLSTQSGKGIDRRELRRNTPYDLRKVKVAGLPVGHVQGSSMGFHTRVLRTMPSPNQYSTAIPAMVNKLSPPLGRNRLGNQACNKRKSIHMKRVVHEFSKAFTCRLYVHRPVGKLETHPQAPFLGRHLALAFLVRLADAVLALYEDADAV